jgi:multidrug resistance efflux pump
MIPLTIEELRDSRIFLDYSIHRGHRLFLYLLILTFATLGIWITVGRIDEWVVGQAVLRPLAAVSSVRNRIAGSVATVPVRHGGIVVAGDTLWAIAHPGRQAELVALETRYRKVHQELSDQRSVLSAIRVFQQSSSTLEAISAMTPEAAAEFRVVLAEHERLSVIAKDALMTLTRNLASASLISEAALQQIETEWRVAELTHRQYLERELTTRSARVDDLEVEIPQIQHSIILVRKEIDAAVVVAVASGNVEFLRDLSAGDYLLAGEEVMRVIPPEATEYRLEITVDERSFRDIRAGQKVTLKFTSLPIAAFGRADGSVTYVPAEGHIGQNDSRVFVVQGTLNQSGLSDRQGRFHEFRPGMSAAARIITGRNPIWSILLKRYVGFDWK